MIYAECWQCLWDAHLDEKHPLPRRERRRIRRAAEKVAGCLALGDARTEHAAQMLVMSLHDAAPGPVGVSETTKDDQL